MFTFVIKLKKKHVFIESTFSSTKFADENDSKSPRNICYMNLGDLSPVEYFLHLFKDLKTPGRDVELIFLLRRHQFSMLHPRDLSSSVTTAPRDETKVRDEK